MKCGSLFTGIRGLDIAVEALGFDVVWHAELDPDASKELDRQRPGVPNYGDVTAIDYSQVEPVEALIGGGWPCQPFSSAGRSRGTDDARYLWPEVARAVRSLRPRYFYMEQVTDVLDERRFPGVFSRCLADLAEAGMDARWGCLRSSDVGAPHGRKRLFLVAHARHGGSTEPRGQRREADRSGVLPSRDHDEAPTNTQGDKGRLRNGNGVQVVADPGGAGTRRNGRGSPTTQERAGRGQPNNGHASVAGGREAVAHADSEGRQGTTATQGRGEPEQLVSGVDWREWEPAIRRWEAIVGAAPMPFVMVEYRGKTSPKLNPEFSAWMMALESPPMLSRRSALRCIGNAVNPIQAYVALSQLDAHLRTSEEEAG